MLLFCAASQNASRLNLHLGKGCEYKLDNDEKKQLETKVTFRKEKPDFITEQ